MLKKYQHQLHCCTALKSLKINIQNIHIFHLIISKLFKKVPDTISELFDNLVMENNYLL